MSCSAGGRPRGRLPRWCWAGYQSQAVADVDASGSGSGRDGIGAQACTVCRCGLPGHCRLRMATAGKELRADSATQQSWRV